MYPPPPPNGHPALPPPSPTDIALGEIRRELWTIREEIGGFKTGQAMIVQAIDRAFLKADQAHGRITEHHGWLRSVDRRLKSIEAEQTRMRLQTGPAPAGPPAPPPPPPSTLASLTELIKAAGTSLPALHQCLMALGGLLALAASLLLVPAPEPTASAPPPSATSPPSAPSFGPWLGLPPAP